ncbi:MAG: HNH endonuclease [Candidatus Magnetominusculus sp. LBB02]|nr:HNH endonuclease [Candidatus Magnetominusculus sp. LBB02]
MPRKAQKRAGSKAADGEIPVITGAFVKREKQKARIVRQTQWWKDKCAAGTCHYCGNGFPPSELTMDHIIPISRGGMSVKSNLAAVCKACNTRKSHSLPWTDTKVTDSDPEVVVKTPSDKWK